MNKTTGYLLALLLATASTLCAQEPLLFSSPIPDGWRTETIPFPLEFAPELPYTGLEELRFSPGMFEQGADDFWTYAFVWWVDADDPTDPQALATHLQTYFQGLAIAVAESRGIDVSQATFSASIDAGPDDRFGGSIETLDAFVTGEQIRLNIEGQVIRCEAQNRLAVFFGLSPQKRDHPVWTELHSIRHGFRCEAPGS